MPREVTHEARGPYIVTPEDIDAEKGDVAVCLCGLSDEYPFCDGSHRATADEDPETLYKYDDGRRRVVAAVEYADVQATDERDEPADGERAPDG